MLFRSVSENVHMTSVLLPLEKVDLMLFMLFACLHWPYLTKYTQSEAKANKYGLDTCHECENLQFHFSTLTNALTTCAKQKVPLFFLNLCFLNKTENADV